MLAAPGSQQMDLAKELLSKVSYFQLYSRFLRNISVFMTFLFSFVNVFIHIHKRPQKFAPNFVDVLNKHMINKMHILE